MQKRSITKQERDKQRVEHHKANGLCIACGQPREDLKKTRCKKCLTRNRAYLVNVTNEKKEQWKVTGKQRREQLRDLVFDHYGPNCQCCGETEKAFLQIDHINDDGNVFRRTTNNTDIVRWLVRNEFPAGYQILCANCNWGKRIKGQCPHKLKRDQKAA